MAGDEVSVSSLSVQREALRSQGWEDRTGLGKELQGSIDLVEVSAKDDLFGLGFKYCWKDKREMKEKKMRRKLARLQGKFEEEKLDIHPIHQSFVSAGKVNMQNRSPVIIPSIQMAIENLAINVVGDEELEMLEKLIFCTIPGSDLLNWTTQEISVWHSVEDMEKTNEYKEREAEKLEFNLETLCDIGKEGKDEIDDSNLPQELLRLVEQEEKQIMPYKESIEMINLGTKK